MDHIDYFKLQAKNLLKDYKTRCFDESEKRYCYHPKYFDIDGIFLWLDYYDNTDDFTFTLMNAQHVIAQMVGFEKWNDLIKAKPAELELAHLLFDNAHKVSLEEWSFMSGGINNAEAEIELFKEIIANKDSYRSDEIPFRFDLAEKRRIPPKDKDFEEKYVPTEVYEELGEQEKLNAIVEHKKNGLGFELETVVECLHCGAVYKFKDVKAIRVKQQFRDGLDFDQIVCKNYPKCDGDIMDLIPASIADRSTSEAEK